MERPPHVVRFPVGAGEYGVCWAGMVRVVRSTMFSKEEARGERVGWGGKGLLLFRSTVQYSMVR